MHETNDLETQLRSWIPRRPSPRVERRLFHGQGARLTARNAGDWHFAGLRLHWLAPTLAGLFVMAVAVSQRDGSGLPAAGGSANLIGLIPSNRLAAAFLPTVSNEHSPASFEWTNGDGSTSSISSLSGSRGKTGS